MGYVFATTNNTSTPAAREPLSPNNRWRSPIDTIQLTSCVQQLKWRALVLWMGILQPATVT
eukprot:4608241-Pyramimonas_sp.AAC.1